MRFFFFLFKTFILFFCLSLIHVYVCRGKGVGSPRTGITDSCEPSWGYQGLSPGPLEQQQPVLLTSELSLQHLLFLIMGRHMQASVGAQRSQMNGVSQELEV